MLLLQLSVRSTNTEDVDGSTTTPGGPVGIVVTDTNLNPIIQMSTWLLLALTSLMFCFRLLSRFFLRSNKLLSVEECLAFSAYIFSVGQAVTIFLPQSRILGKDISLISVQELRSGLITTYAGDLLLILALGLSKLSACACLLSLSPDAVHRAATFGVGAVALLWTLSSCFGSAFRCGTHHPWDSRSDECFDMRAFLQYVGITNILTDAALVALPVVMMYPLNLPHKTRTGVVLIFGSRILVIVPTILQLVYLDRLFEENYTLRAFPYYLCVQIAQFASIAAACVVYLWPFLQSLRSGLMWADNLNESAFSSKYGSFGFSKFFNVTTSGGGSNKPSSNGSNMHNNNGTSSSGNHVKEGMATMSMPAGIGDVPGGYGCLDTLNDGERRNRAGGLGGQNRVETTSRLAAPSR